MDQAQANRPQKVAQAITFAYAALGVGLLRSIAEAPRLGQLASAGVAILSFGLAVLGLTWLFIHHLGKGRNWARIGFLALFMIIFVSTALPLVQSLADEPLSGALGIAQLGLQIVALVFLFQKPADEWFVQRKYLKQSA